MILIYIETPNKFDRTYGNEYNITNMDVLEEMSNIEETLNPDREDQGTRDEITFVLSISTLIKEIYSSPRRISEAMGDELGVSIIGGENFPGAYAIPDDQEDIDDIVVDIPEDTRSLFVRDTNEDEIWDTAVIWIGVVTNLPEIEKDIDNIIDPYSNNGESWWQSIVSGEIHCAMINLGYVESRAQDHEISDVPLMCLSPVIFIILAGLLFLLMLIIRTRIRTAKDFEKMKINIITITIIFIILMLMIIPTIFLNLSAPQPNDSNQYSEEFGGGQLGMVLVRGNPAPEADDVPTKGTGSLKDIDVLDGIDNMEVWFEDIYNPSINSPLNIVDVMKMINMLDSNSTYFSYLPPPVQETLDEFMNISFWDAIHIADNDTNTPWGLWYGKSQQDSMINIFYNSITLEMRSIFVNIDYSRSLLYISIPVIDEYETQSVIDDINNIITHHPVGAGTTTADVVLIGESSDSDIRSVLSISLLLTLVSIGIIVFLFSLFKIRKGDKGDYQNSPESWPPEQPPMNRYPPQR